MRARYPLNRKALLLRRQVRCHRRVLPRAAVFLALHHRPAAILRNETKSCEVTINLLELCGIIITALLCIYCIRYDARGQRVAGIVGEPVWTLAR